MTKIKMFFINLLTQFLTKRKAIKELQEENMQLMALKQEIGTYKNVYDVAMPNVNTPFELIEFDQIQEINVIDQSVILVELPDEKLALTIEDDQYLLEFLKRTITLCGVCTIGRERVLFSKGTEFYLEVSLLDGTINIAELREVIYNATWHIRTQPTTYDWYNKQNEKVRKKWQ